MSDETNLVFASTEDVEKYLAPAPVKAAAVEPATEELPEPDTEEAAPPDDEVTVLKRMSEEALIKVNRLRQTQRDVLKRHEEIGHEISQAQIAADRAVAAYRSVAPKPPLPPVPTHDEWMAIARAKRPDLNPETINQWAGWVHGNMSDGLARAGEGNQPRSEEMTGINVRDVDDHAYEITSPPKDAEPGQYRPSSVKPRDIKHYD